MRSVRRLPLLALICIGSVLCLSFYQVSLSKLQTFQPSYSTEAISKIRSVEELKQEFGFSAAVCVAMKDAEAYFEEWIDFHLAMEFSNIYIYDDSDDFELQYWYQNTRNHSIYSRVEVLNNRKLFTEYNILKKDKKTKKNKKVYDGRQLFAYHHCVNRFGVNGPKHDYMALIDIDEFFMLQTTKYSGILGVLHDYLAPYGGALTVNWMLVGDANKTVYSPLPLTKRFQYRDNSPDLHIKSIVKSTDYLLPLSPHIFTLRSGKVRTTEFPGALRASGAVEHARPSDILLLYHYRYTSKKEYHYKRCVRGRPAGDNAERCSAATTGITRKGRSHIKALPGSVFDERPWQFLKAHVPKYQMYDQFEDYHSQR